MGTGFYINPTPPEESARFLREAGWGSGFGPRSQTLPVFPCPKTVAMLELSLILATTPAILPHKRQDGGMDVPIADDQIDFSIAGGPAPSAEDPGYKGRPPHSRSVD